MPSVLAILAVTAEDRARARQKLLSGLADGRIRLWYPGFLEATEAVAVTPQERSDVREVIVGLPGFSRGQNVRDLARIVACFAVSAEEQREFRELLLGLLARQDDAFTAAELTRRLSSLDPPESERAYARETLLKLLARESYPNQSEALAKGVAALAVTAQERRFSREALTGELSRRGYGRTAQLARVTVAVADTAEERQQVRGALASLLAATDDARQALDLAREISRLDPSPQDLERGRSVLLRLLRSERDSGVAA